MKKRLVFAVLAVVVACGLAGIAQASIVAIGDPFEVGSWAQRFQEDGVGNFNTIGIVLTSGGPLETPTTFANFTNVLWAQVPGGTTGLASASGPALNWMQFDLKFAGYYTPVAFDFVALDVHPDGSFTTKENVHASYNGRWSYGAGAGGSPELVADAAAVPEPATLVIWSLLGLGWAGLSVTLRRRHSLGLGGAGRQVWSPETRTAIHQIIEQGQR